MKEDIQTLRDLFMEWFYKKNRTWKSLPEFITANHFGNALTPHDLSDLMLGKATLPPQTASFLLQKNPFKLTAGEIDNLNRQSFLQNRFSRVIEVNEANLSFFKDYLAHPKNYIHLSEERVAARKETKRKHEQKLSKQRAAKVMMPLIEAVQRKLEQDGKIEPIELTEEIIRKRKKKQRIQEIKELKKDPNYVHRRPRKYKTEEEAIAARKEMYRKSNSGKKHAQWEQENAEKVAAYKKAWYENNLEKSRQSSRNYKKRKKIKTIINLLRGIVNYQQSQSATTPISVNRNLTENQNER